MNRMLHALAGLGEALLAGAIILGAIVYVLTFPIGIIAALGAALVVLMLGVFLR